MCVRVRWSDAVWCDTTETPDHCLPVCWTFRISSAVFSRKTHFINFICYENGPKWRIYSFIHVRTEFVAEKIACWTKHLVFKYPDTNEPLFGVFRSSLRLWEKINSGWINSSTHETEFFLACSFRFVWEMGTFIHHSAVEAVAAATAFSMDPNVRELLNDQHLALDIVAANAVHVWIVSFSHQVKSMWRCSERLQAKQFLAMTY